MNKTNIPWVASNDGRKGYSWNVGTGCMHGCAYCYAKELYRRYGWSFVPTFHRDRLVEPRKLKEPSRIFAGSVCDYGGSWLWQVKGSDRRIPRSVVLDLVLGVVKQCPQHTFIFLTKNVPGFCDVKWPSNTIVGASADNHDDAARRSAELGTIAAPIKCLSLEPLLEDVAEWVYWPNVNWLIIGGCTGRMKFQPAAEWIDKLVERAGWFGVPVFIKPNARYLTERREWPIERALV